MANHDLEKNMALFASGHFDVLICTPIIESGLDIPRANTIIIYALDNLPLSRMYQLRGRVGRSTVQAYAYVMTPASKLRSESMARSLMV